MASSRLLPAIFKAVNADSHEEAKRKMQEELISILDKLELRLQTHKYLCCDTFTAADLTLASLCAPLVAPIETDELYSTELTSEKYPIGFIQFVERVRNHNVGKFVLEIYKKHRFSIEGQPKERGKKVHVNVSNRNKIFLPLVLFGSIGVAFASLLIKFFVK